MAMLKHIPPVHYAIAVSSLGAVAGTTFSIMAILTMADIAGGLSVSSDDAAWFNTLYNVGAICGLPIVMTMAASLGRVRAMLLAGLFFRFFTESRETLKQERRFD